MENSIYIGKVFHGRHQPFEHKFQYGVFSLFLDLDDLPALSKNLKFFSFNRWNILGFYNKDHGARDGSDMRPWIENAAQEKNIDIKDGKIFVLFFSRLWGYVFNPITIYFCYNIDNQLKAIVYEVKNTFGQQHAYLIPIDDKHKAGERISQQCQKIFHVSPFIQMDCTYHFKLKEPGEDLDVAIHQFQPDGKILTATWDGKRKPFTDSEILKTVFKHPVMTFKVIAGIHWEALKLWIKGAKYIKKPPLPEKDIS